MKTLPLWIMTVWLGLATWGQGQISMFPAPPSLPSRSSSSSSDMSTNGASGVTPTSDFGISNPGGSNNSSTSGNNGGSNPGEGSIPATAEMLTSMTALDDKITLKPGDRISFRVIEDKDQAVPRLVTDTGEVDFPYIGRVKVQGETCHQAAVELKRLLEVDYYKRATVIVGLDVIADRDKDKSKTHDMAWVVGQVRTTGPQELNKAQPMTVSQLIMKAGGFGDFAEQHKVKVIHRGALPATANGEFPPETASAQDVQVVDVKAVFEGKSTLDPVIQANDYIIVPKRLVNF